MTSQHEQYANFLRTWAPHCGAPASVFKGHLDVLIADELRSAGEDVLAVWQEHADQAAPQWRALARLLADLTRFLETHLCSDEGHTTITCPDRSALTDRIARAEQVLGLAQLTHRRPPR